MIRGFKVKLHPTENQKILMLRSFGTARWAYNWALNRQKESYEAGGKFLSTVELKKEITKLKKQEDFKWLCEVSAKIPAQAVIDLCEAYEKFFKKKSGFPKFKCKRNNNDSFFQREDHFSIKDNKVLLEKIGFVAMAEDIIPKGENVKYYNPRIKYDGINIWLTVGVEVSENQTNKAKTEPIGIDLGIKKLAVCSNGMEKKRPSIKKYLKRLKRLQRRASRIYLYMEKNKVSFKEKSKRLVKLEKQILKTNHRITNILKDNIHKMTADRWYPSSKLCSRCGEKKEKLSLSERVFVCDKCGLHIDRDFNAALNLRKLAM